MISGKVGLFDAEGWTAYLVEQVDQALQETAHFVPIDVTDRIWDETTPAGGAQKQNSPPVRQRKLGTLGHAIPLIQTGRLADAASWIVERIANGWIVRPPTGRARVIVYLRRGGYRLFEMSPAILAFAAEQLREASRRAQAAIPRYTREVTVG